MSDATLVYSSYCRVRTSYTARFRPGFEILHPQRRRRLSPESVRLFARIWNHLHQRRKTQGFWSDAQLAKEAAVADVLLPEARAALVRLRLIITHVSTDGSSYTLTQLAKDEAQRRIAISETH